MNTDYVIQGGEAGRSRLNILSAVMESHTQNLLQALGVKEGMRFIDNGAGGGHVAMMAAGMVGTTGTVVATDADKAILHLAAQEAQEKGFQNIEFVATAPASNFSLPQASRLVACMLRNH